jgi:arylsulfatase A-like enzyme
MTARSLIVLVVDRLGAGWLGPYGATWIDTPNFNRLAAASLLCENVLADSPSLEQTYRGYLLGEHALASAAGREAWHQLQSRLESTGDSLLGNEGSSAATPATSWLHQAQADQRRTLLLTDDPEVAHYEACQAFAEHIVLPVSDPSEPADDVDATGLAHIFEAAADTLRNSKPPFVLFIHARGLSGPWDAPLELRNRFADEDDPTPPSFVTPPNLRATAQFDPDELLGYRQAYAGQVTLLDMCLGMLIDEIDRQPWSRQSALVVTSPRGYPLGHHGRIGPCDEALYGDLLHVPLLLRLPDGSTLAQRRRGLVQSPGLAATTADLLGYTPPAATSSRSLLRLLHEHQPAEWQLACALGPEQRLIRTPAWLMRETLLGDHLHHELFAKPDDYWEVNEVANRGGDIVQLLAAELDRRHRDLITGRLSHSAPLPEPLVSLWR